MTDAERTELAQMRQSIRQRRMGVGADLPTEYYLSLAEWSRYQRLIQIEIAEHTKPTKLPIDVPY